MRDLCLVVNQREPTEIPPARNASKLACVAGGRFARNDREYGVVKLAFAPAKLQRSKTKTTRPEVHRGRVVLFM